jgi:Zn finger protein HypA/HybF involved in hydrogenase expression
MGDDECDLEATFSGSSENVRREVYCHEHLDRVREMIGGDETAAPSEEYRCGTCQSKFEATAEDDTLVTCPNCGSDVTRPV